MENQSTKLNKAIKISITVAVLITALSIAYYLVIFIPKRTRTQLDQQKQEVKANSTYSFEEAHNHIGEYAIVTGTVVKVVRSYKAIFLDFCDNYQTCPFVGVIFTSGGTSQYGNLSEYQGKNISVRGIVANYKGRAEIIISDPSQISL